MQSLKVACFLVGSFFVVQCEKSPMMENAHTLVEIDMHFEGAIKKDEKTPTQLIYRSAADTLLLSGTVESRGGYSIDFPKQSYEIDLPTDVALANLPADDDWVLNANFIDKTFLRHVLAYELFADMNPNNMAPACKYVNLFLNGQYNGLYVLMEKLDKSTLGISANDETAFIFKEPHLFRASYENITPQDPSNFHQQTFPDIASSDKSAYLEAIRTLILEGSDTAFAQSMPYLFDMENLIDWHLLLLISNNSDGILKNFYLYKQDAETPLRVAPWDYDHSFGRDGDGELNIDQRPLRIERSILFERLLELHTYQLQLKARWHALNQQGLLSKEGLRNRIFEKCEQIAQAVHRNERKWSVASDWYYDDYAFTQEIDIMLQFITLRHQRLEQYFSN